MKKLYLILTCCFCSSLGFAQTRPEFAPIGATWYYQHIHYSDAGFDFTKLISLDSVVVLGQKGKRISNDTLATDSLHMYRFIATRNKWTLLADFSKQVGDSFYVDASYPGTADSFTVHIVSKGDTVINGFTLPYIVTDFMHTSATSQQDLYGGQIIQNIGSLNFLFPYPAQVDPPPASGLRCYTDINLGTYKTSLWPCDSVYIVSGVQNIYNVSRPILYHQDANAIYLEFKSGQWSSLQVYDVLGRRLLEKKIDKSASSVTLSSLYSEHIYFVEFQKDNFSQTIKVYKE